MRFARQRPHWFATDMRRRLSDRDVDASHAAIPSLLALAAVHNHMIREGLRSQVSLVVETGDAREVSHIALLFAYGASALHPYLALASVHAAEGGTAAERNYVKAVEKGTAQDHVEDGRIDVAGLRGRPIV
jgi:glutamate synthase (NADPH/NADH) large chain